MRHVVAIMSLAAAATLPGPARAQQPDEAWIGQVRAADADIAAAAKGLPAGATPCDFGAWSTDPDRNGLNVRAEPSAKAKVIHRVPPPVLKSRVMRDAGDESPLRSDFRVLGHKDGWFLIDRVRSAAAIEASGGDSDARRSMRGWVSASRVGGAFAYGGAPGDRLYETPDPTAAFTQMGDSLIGDLHPKRLLACSGGWVQVELADGRKGWFRTLCSSQIALCN